jgi:hypothetical protein
VIYSIQYNYRFRKEGNGKNLIRAISRLPVFRYYYPDLSIIIQISPLRSVQISPLLSRSLHYCPDLSITQYPDLSITIQISPLLSRSLHYCPDLSPLLSRSLSVAVQISLRYLARVRRRRSLRLTRRYPVRRRSLWLVKILPGTLLVSTVNNNPYLIPRGPLR